MDGTEFNDELDEYTYICSGRRTGKSTNLAKRALYELNNGFHVVLMAPTLDRTIHLKHLIRELSGNVRFTGSSAIISLSSHNVEEKFYGMNTDRFKWFWDDVNEYFRKVIWCSGHYYTDCYPL
jgi:hypothetical protein